jgi:hypothetical protein
MRNPRQTTTRRARRTIGAVCATALALTGLVAASSPASAVTPSFPDNIVVFPDRDFISVEGYAARAGQIATVEVTRPGVGVMGSAKVPVSGTDVAFEINHPGGFCWGANTTLDVTPDIKAGDVVSVAFPDGTKEETVTSGASVTQDMTLNGDTLTVRGVLGGANPDQFEQRIIQPDLVGTTVGKRDVRALPGPLTPVANNSYSSGVAFNVDSPGDFVATYVFADAANAAIAAAADLGERAMTWQVQDADGNRQGLTIAEFGEAGGPGMGGCPQGPGNQQAPVGSASVIHAPNTATAALTWTPVAPQPGADLVTGYSIEAIDAAQNVRGVRTAASATTANLSGLDPTATYTFEVRSMAGGKMSQPFAMGGPADTTAPTLSVSPAPGAGVTQANSVSVTSNGQVFFTKDGSPVVSGSLPSDTAQLLTGTSIPITALTTLKVVAFDQAGNHSALIEGDYQPVSLAAPTKVAGLTGTKTQTSASLTWTASPAAQQVTGYQVKVSNATGPLATQPPVTAVASQTITGLTPGTAYTFTVAAKNAGGTGPASDPITLTTDQQTDRVTITSAKWKLGDFKVVGTGSVVGNTVQVYAATAAGTIGAAIPGATAAVVLAVPPGIGDFTIRLRNGQPTTNPGRIFVKSSGGGVAGPFTVTNG